jgi:hypothetical protein
MKEIIWLVIITVSLVGVMSARGRVNKLRWLLVLSIVALAGGIYVSRNGILRAALDILLFFERHTVLFVVLLALSLVGVFFAWLARWTTLGWVCGLIVGLAVDLVVVKSRALSYWIDFGQGVSFPWDTVLFFLLLTLSLVGLIAAWRARLQPLGWVCGLMIVVLAAGLYASSVLYGQPEDFADIEDQFKYGSIGSDHFLARGIPYWIWKVLPEKFPPQDILPAGYKPTTDKKSYEAFGLLMEENHKVRLIGQVKDKDIDRPIGFSKRKVFGMDFIGINCAFCHVSTIRYASTNRTDGQNGPQIMLGMPANTVDIELFFLFLFAAAEDKDFYDKVTNGVTSAIWKLEPDPDMGRVKRFAYRVGYRFLLVPVYRFALIPLTQMYVQRLKEDFYFIDPQKSQALPRFGPGRVDAWSPAKTTLVPKKQKVKYPGGIIDHMSIWNQKAREGMRFHWDGNTDVLLERNIVAGLVVNGPAIECLDVERLTKITDWIKTRPAPRFDDFRPNTEAEGYSSKMDKVENGGRIFQRWCASCHAPGGDRVGRVEPLDTVYLDTDPGRMNVFTAELADALNKIGTDKWQLRHFEVQKGYVNTLLDGIWLRAPYLHNGSVPTLADLLKKPETRPKKFYRGNDMYDWDKVGFKYDVAEAHGNKFFEYDTSKEGNRNTGHLYGTDLSNDDKEALLEFLKTL